MTTTTRQQIITGLRTAIISIAITALTFAVHFQYFSRLPFLFPVNNRIKHNIAAQPKSTSSDIMTAEFLKDDYRAFIFATHPRYGILLLRCTRKKNKGPHFQAPGGHIDKEDFEYAESIMQDDSNQGRDILMQACKIGAARELFEETGMDIRSELDRLQPARLWDSSKDSLINVLKFRLFFKLRLEDSDFAAGDIESKISLGLVQSMNTSPPHLMASSILKLSHEHQGWRFEADAMKAVDLLVDHSGGKVSKALEMAVGQGEIYDAKGELDVANFVEKYAKDDYRAFIFATHPRYGILLLHCTRKKKKGPHFQAPGGRIDKEDFEYAVSNMQDDSNQGRDILMQACKIGAARELFEETGMDIRSELDR
ncbi:hypothetical protein ACHAW5_011321 [Stephanodiscus triporus]|uniref:Nudix hydrolase domain-containing protein n=1 Tax=Stephanodiscus triporus TaxID=2934178 RepID=A0ABD3NLG1_9STRA